MRSDRHRVTEQTEIGQDNGRRIRRIDYLVGKKCRPAIEAPKEHLSTRTLEAGSATGQIRPRKPVRRRETREQSRTWVESRDTVIGAHPQIAVLVFKDTIDRVPWQTIKLRKRDDSTGWIAAIQSVLGANPHGACVIEAHRIYSVAAKPAQGVSAMLGDGEPSARRIKFQKACIGTGPHLAITVLHECADKRRLRSEPERGESFVRGVEAIEAVCSANPQRFVMIKKQAHDNVTAETVRVGGIVPVGLGFSGAVIDVV